MDWQEVTVCLNKQAEETAASIMEELGASGVIFTDDNPGNDGNDRDYQDRGVERTGIIAYYPDDQNFDDLLERLRQRLDSLEGYGLKSGKVVIRTALTRDKDWSTSWHKYFKPLPLGRSFLICPSWEDCSGSERAIIKLDPGEAFGTGTHETTMLSVELMERYIEYNTHNMLDVGTGTGILAIVAARLGVEQVLGVDIEVAAVRAARENTTINQVDHQVEIRQGDLTSDIRGSFSLITANLLPDLLSRLVPSLPELMAPSGRLILSGINREKRHYIISLVEGLGLEIRDERSLNDWVSLLATVRRERKDSSYA